MTIPKLVLRHRTDGESWYLEIGGQKIEWPVVSYSLSGAVDNRRIFKLEIMVDAVDVRTG